MTNILITGANGQLGRSLKDCYSNLNNALLKIHYTDSDSLDITNIETLDSYIYNNKIDLIINCAAYTAVDNAEDDIETCYKVNSIAVENIAKCAIKYNSSVIHISTDYVFDGKSYIPYKESDPTNPVSIYGKSKLDGEIALSQQNINYVILRTSWLYSIYGNNFVKTITKLCSERDSLNVVYDQIGTPTYAPDLANAIISIAETMLEKSNNSIKGIYNYSNLGVCSWYDFAVAIAQLNGFSTKIAPVESSAFVVKAKRPHYSVLDKSKIIQTFNLSIPYWRESLKDAIKGLK
jgi:dTDP-4-dehydrorhamnose reductase